MGTNLMKISTISILSGIAKWSAPCVGCWHPGGPWKNILRKHAGDYDQPLEISHWEAAEVT